MKITSHFVWIELKNEIFSDIFVKIWEYLNENNVENIIDLQNPLSPHITIYYLEKDFFEIDEIKNYIKNFEINKEIFVDSLNYFFRWEKRFVLYFTIKTENNLENIRNTLHKKYKRDFVEDNNFSFSTHITIWKIKNFEIFENHRTNIEKILLDEISKIKDIDISSKKIFLYAVNSNFREEIQIKK